MESKFKDFAFKSKEAMFDWLNYTTFKVINLKDYGQDMQKIWIHESGEILNCDFHSRIYNGRFVDLKQIKVGDCLRIREEGKRNYVRYGRLVIESTE
jgi:hypothetical protein